MLDKMLYGNTKLVEKVHVVYVCVNLKCRLQLAVVVYACEFGHLREKLRQKDFQEYEASQGCSEFITIWSCFTVRAYLRKPRCVCVGVGVGE